MALKVCMFVHNNFKRDSRVLKEARTLAEAGYDVRVIALLDKVTEPYEERDGFRIIRVVKDPLHYKILRVLRRICFPTKVGHKRTKGRCQLACLKHNRLVGRLKQAYREIDQGIKEKGAKGYIRDIIKADSLRFFAFRWILLSGYYIYRYILRPLRRGIRRPVKRAIYRPAKTICRYTRKIWFWGTGCLRKMRKVFLRFFYHKAKSSLRILYRPLSFLDYYYRSLQLVREEPADIYHAHDLNTLPAAYWARKKMGGKLVYDSHELYTETSTLPKFEKLASKIFERYLIRRVNTVITVNGSIANELLKRYKVRLPIVIMNCPKIGYQKRKPRNSLLRQKLGLDGEIPVILYQGGYALNRGLQNLIMSAHYLNKAIIVLMGWGKLEQELKDLTEAEGLGERIRFAAPVPQQDLLYYTASATLGVIPYQFVGLNNYYTSPNKLFEYMAAGLPVVGSNFPELKRVIEEYNLGKTFNPDDPEDIAEAINYVLSDKDRYEEMKRNALRAAKVFNWENESKKLLGIYRRLEDELNIASN